MAWKPAPAELVELMDSALEPFLCLKKKMFGYPAYFVNGNMFTGLHEDRVILRLCPRDREAILVDGSKSIQFEPRPGRPMKEYVVLLQPIYQYPAVFKEWLDRSFNYASSLPPKEKR